jgi:ParB family chromosome partitioning protein
MIQKVKIDDIIIEERMRKEYQNIESLGESLKTKGQITPIILNKNMKLVAGGRRITAAKLIKWIELDARILPTADTLDDLDIEFIENFQREDFSWAERAFGIAKLHEAHKSKDYKWSQRDTAALLGIGKSTVNNQLQLVAWLKELPELINSESEKAALQKISALEEAIYTKELADRPEEVKEVIPTQQETQPEIPPDVKEKAKAEMQDILSRIDQLKREGITDELGNKILPSVPEYIVGDFFLAAKDMKDGSYGDYALIECDPPYAIDLQETKESKPSMLDSYNEISKEAYPDWTRQLMSEFYRLLGINSRVIYWFGIEWYDMVYKTASSAGFSVSPIPGIWYKTNSSGQNKQPRVNLSNVYEPFFILRKGMPILGRFGAKNVFAYDMVPDKEKIHPTERPLDLLLDIIPTVANKTAVSQCVVPFLGSGKTLKACKQLGIKAWGYDKSQEFRDRYVINR